MLPDWVSNPGPLTYESGALLIALRSPAILQNPPLRMGGGGGVGNVDLNHKLLLCDPLSLKST